MSGEEDRSWYLTYEGERHGPYTRAEILRWLHEGRITRDVLCWNEGMAAWAPLAQVPDFQGGQVAQEAGARARPVFALSDAAKRRLRTAARALAGIVIIAVAGIGVYYAFDLDCPAPIRKTRALYRTGEYGEAYVALSNYIEHQADKQAQRRQNASTGRKLPFFREAEPRGLIDPADSPFIKQRIVNLGREDAGARHEALAPGWRWLLGRAELAEAIHPEALFVMGQLVLFHGPEIAASLCEHGKDASMAEDIPWLVGFGDGEELFEEVIRLDPSYQSKVIDALSEAVSDRLDPDPDVIVERLVGPCLAFVRNHDYRSATETLAAAPLLGKPESDQTTRLMSVLSRYDNTLAKEHQRAYDRLRAAESAERLRAEVARRLAPDTARSLKDVTPETSIGVDLQAVAELLGPAWAEDQLDSDARDAFAALMDVYRRRSESASSASAVLSGTEWDPIVEVAVKHPKTCLTPVLDVAAKNSDLGLSLLEHVPGLHPPQGGPGFFSAEDAGAICRAVADTLARTVVAHADGEADRDLDEYCKERWPSARMKEVCDALRQRMSSLFEPDRLYFTRAWINSHEAMTGRPDVNDYLREYPNGVYAALAQRFTRLPLPPQPEPEPMTPADMAELERLRELKRQVDDFYAKAKDAERDRVWSAVRRYSQKVIDLAGNVPSLADIVADADELLRRAELAADPSTRFFVERISMVDPDGRPVVCTIHDRLYRTEHMVGVGDWSPEGYMLESVDRGGRTATIIWGGKSYTIGFRGR